MEDPKEVFPALWLVFLQMYRYKLFYKETDDYEEIKDQI